MVNILASKQCISAFGNLSTIQLIYTPWPYILIPSPEWHEAKDASIRRLKSSLTDGPKKLKTVMLISRAWAYSNRDPKVVVEEIIF